MKETGVVHAISDGEVLVRLKRRAACLGCKACFVSSAGDMIIKAVATDRMHPPGKNFGAGVKVGDEITIEIDSASIIKAITLLYLLPAVAFLVGIFAGLKIASLLGIYTHKEIIAILIGVTLLSASLFLARGYGVKKSGAYQAKITGIVKSE